MGKRPITLIILTALLGLAPLSGHAAEDELFDTQAAQQHMDQGIADLKTKHYDAAIAEFEKSADIAPEAEAYYYMGYAYYLKAKSGQDTAMSRKKSRENFDKAYEIDPGFTPTRLKPAEQAPEAQPPEKSPEPPAPQPATQQTETSSAPSPSTDRPIRLRIQ